MLKESHFPVCLNFVPALLYVLHGFDKRTDFLFSTPVQFWVMLLLCSEDGDFFMPPSPSTYGSPLQWKQLLSGIIQAALCPSSNYAMYSEHDRWVWKAEQSVNSESNISDMLLLTWLVTT